MSEATSGPDAHELDSLLGAYALDALDAEDRARVDAYLQHDAAARAEVDEMRETAASLALLPDTQMDAPPELWSRIEHEIGAASPAAPSAPAADLVDELGARRAKRSRTSWTATIAAVAAAIAIVLLATQVVTLHHQVDTSHEIGSSATKVEFDRAVKVPGAREVGLESGSGATLARLVLLPDGRGYLRGDHLAPLSAKQTYQLWALTGSAKNPNVVSAGVLGPDPSAVSFSASGPVHGFAVTIESAGGVVVSHHAAIASAQLA
jgi:anti-sigma-K factor RskA